MKYFFCCRIIMAYQRLLCTESLFRLFPWPAAFDAIIHTGEMKAQKRMWRMKRAEKVRCGSHDGSDRFEYDMQTRWRGSEKRRLKELCDYRGQRMEKKSKTRRRKWRKTDVSKGFYHLFRVYTRGAWTVRRFARRARNGSLPSFLVSFSAQSTSYPILRDLWRAVLLRCVWKSCHFMRNVVVRKNSWHYKAAFFWS